MSSLDGVRFWSKPDHTVAGRGTGVFLVLPTVGCYWARRVDGGCRMCNYLADAPGKPPSQEQLLETTKKVVDKALLGLEYPVALKFFTSGSFLDSEEVSSFVRRELVRYVAERDEIVEIVVESRPEFVTSDSLVDLQVGGDKYVEVAIGLESFDEHVRNFCVNKGVTLEMFEKALNLLRENGLGVKVYLLLKPPYITEKAAYNDVIKSLVEMERFGVDTVSINPCTVHKGTETEKLFRRGEYRPPWLWTILKVLRKGSKHGYRLLCDPVAAGKPRGPHNCGLCDQNVKAVIETFSTTQDRDVLAEPLTCRCQEEWELILTAEEIINTPLNTNPNPPKG